MEEFEKIYSEYYDSVYRYLLALCGDEAWAEEITQEAFFKALKNIGSFRGECKLSVWLCQIAKNCFYTAARRRNRQADAPLEMIPDPGDMEQKTGKRQWNCTGYCTSWTSLIRRFSGCAHSGSSPLRRSGASGENPTAGRV